jgi:hypothetical protein
MNTRNSRLRTALIAGVSACALALLPATSAVAGPRTVVTGEITCLNNASPVGVWVDARNGTDGWATITVPIVIGGHSKVRYSYTLSQGGDYRVNVGCGGTSKAWKLSLSSGWLVGNANLRCNDIPWYLVAAQKVLWRLAGKADLTQGIAYGACGRV